MRYVLGFIGIDKVNNKKSKFKIHTRTWKPSERSSSQVQASKILKDGNCKSDKE